MYRQFFFGFLTNCGDLVGAHASCRRNANQDVFCRHVAEDLQQQGTYPLLTFDGTPKDEGGTFVFRYEIDFGSQEAGVMKS